jgi:aryl-alcohol dehydrogenase-like predicted oxidoreductase
LSAEPELRPLGRTGLRVSRVGFGLAAVGRPAYINIGHSDDLGPERSVDALRRRSETLLDAAFAAGTRYFDAARSYGRAEEFLGGWLRSRGVAPGAVTVGSKWGYTYTGGWRLEAERHEVKDLSVDTLRRQLDETRALIGDHLSLYQIHSATRESGVLDDPAVLAELGALRDSGVAVGLTVTGPDQAGTIDAATGLGSFDTVQATWNLLERSAEPALERAHDAGMGVIVKEALANGRLTSRGASGTLSAIAGERGVSPDSLAIAAALSQPWAGVVLSGASTHAQLQSNLAALELEFGEEVERRLRELTEDPSEYWSRRSALAWT